MSFSFLICKIRIVIIIKLTSKDVLRIKGVIICKAFRTISGKQEEYIYMSVKEIISALIHEIIGCYLL